MKILIAGGSGFIGTNLIRRLLTTTDHCVLNLDKLSYAANPRSLADLGTHESLEKANRLLPA